MKKVILFPFTLMLVVTGIAQTSTSTTLRTLNLPSEYSVVDGWITDYAITRQLTLIKYVDLAKQKKTVTKDIFGKVKITWSNKPDSFVYEITSTIDELHNAGTYMPNAASFAVNSTRDNYFDPTNPYIILKDHKEINIVGYGDAWYGHTRWELFPNSNPLTYESQGELGANNNVIQKVFVKRVNNVSEYKNPVDYLGREIKGEDVPNGGAPSSAMKITSDKALMTVKLITRTATGSGSWSTSKPVWTGGIKTFENTNSTYVPVKDLPTLFGKTLAELEYELRTTVVCAKLNPATHILSTSCEVIWNGNAATGIVYYSGKDANVTKPTGKITSYNKVFPGYKIRWRLYNGEVNDMIYGSSWVKEYSSSADNTINVIAGDKVFFNAATNTLTYNKNKPAELWFTWEELPAQGKNWGGEARYKLESGNPPVRVWN